MNFGTNVCNSWWFNAWEAKKNSWFGASRWVVLAPWVKNRSSEAIRWFNSKVVGVWWIPIVLVMSFLLTGIMNSTPFSKQRGLTLEIEQNQWIDHSDQWIDHSVHKWPLMDLTGSVCGFKGHQGTSPLSVHMDLLLLRWNRLRSINGIYLAEFWKKVNCPNELVQG